MVASAEMSRLQFTLPQGMPVPGGQPPLMTAAARAAADAAAALQGYQQAQAALNALPQFQQQQYRHQPYQPYQPPVQQHQQGLPGPQVGGPFAGVSLDWPVPMLLTVHTRFA